MTLKKAGWGRSGSVYYSLFIFHPVLLHSYLSDIFAFFFRVLILKKKNKKHINQKYVYWLPISYTNHYLFISASFSFLDIDECAVLHVCPLNSVCNNTVGSFQCICNNGYSKVAGICQGCFFFRFCFPISIIKALVNALKSNIH